MTIDDQELMAYVDGELDADGRARVETAAAADGAVAARIEAQQSLRARLQAHFDPVLEEPVPPSLRAAVAPGAASSAVVALRPSRRHWRWQEWSAMAATLVLGVLLGPYVLRSSQPLPFISANGRVVAIRDLEEALQRQTSGVAATSASGIAIGMSFRAADGTYCRTFAMDPGPAGLACREWGEWVVEVLSRNPRARQAAGNNVYRQAGTNFPESIRQAVESRIAGEPLTVEEETEQAARGWRASRP